ncbi:hypothetical protein DdX_13652 [Ditylenchus destructor]|uniref:Uncharacterized protein n=1 Tax=Ditylenchus destructor TaxID=166010 RepID=A0AAD4R2M0_9BILA|nr:hypothetical protein DdX_13652 [Ditylenchus destructor]
MVIFLAILILHPIAATNTVPSEQPGTKQSETAEATPEDFIYKEVQFSISVSENGKPIKHGNTGWWAYYTGKLINLHSKSEFIDGKKTLALRATTKRDLCLFTNLFTVHMVIMNPDGKGLKKNRSMYFKFNKKLFDEWQRAKFSDLKVEYEANCGNIKAVLRINKIGKEIHGTRKKYSGWYTGDV